MASVKELYMDIENILTENRGWTDIGDKFDGSLTEMLEQCSYVYASYNEMVEYCSYKFGEYAYKDEKIFWVWDENKSCYNPNSALTEIICDLMFKSMLKAKNN